MRDTLEIDVLIVGGGPAGLSTAISLAQLFKNENQPPPSIMIIEKANQVGNHTLSGAVLDPIALNELLPNYRNLNPPTLLNITEDKLLLLTKNNHFSIPFIPSQLQNEGNYIISLAEFVKWLAQVATTLGIDVMTGFTGADLIFDGDKVTGVTTGDKGIDKNGNKKPNYEAGIDIRSKVVVLAEGSRGSLTKVLINKFSLDKNSNPQVYALGVKEIWKVPDKNKFSGKVFHTLGYPAGLNTFGGGFIYGMYDGYISVGYVVGLDYENPKTDPHRYFQLFKLHPLVKEILKDGEIISYGAKTIPEGGLFSMPKMFCDGCLIVGDSAGFLNSFRLKGVHLAMKSGMLAAKTIFNAFKKNDFSENTLSQFYEYFKKSWAYDELFSVRNFRQAYQKGFFYGITNTALIMLTKGRGFTNKLPTKPGHSFMKKYLTSDSVPEKFFDNKYTFDKVTDVYYSGTIHDENQPCHLKVSDTDICSTKCAFEYGNPCQYFCPANVYEMLPLADEDKKRLPKFATKKLNLNFTNCVHCKTCDIMDPYQIITWLPPEGGGGPNYKLT